jgi:hypothetical protein
MLDTRSCRGAPTPFNNKNPSADFHYKIFLVLISFYLFLGCKSGNTVKPNPDATLVVTPLSSPTPQVENLVDTEQLTFTGDNRFASVSDDNTKILFASRLRSQHREFQIYELSLIQNKEDRLTFNDGSSIEPIYADSKSRIYFASSTDEVKEFQSKADALNNFLLPFNFYDPSSTNMKLEIYSLNLTDKKNIPYRLTEQAGYDSNPQYLNQDDHAWVQKDQKNFNLTKWSAKNKKTIEIHHQPDPIWKVSWNNSLLQWVWISWKSENPSLGTQVYIYKEKSKTPEALVLPEGIYHDVSWLPNENRIILSAQLKNSKDFDIYLFDLQEQCLKPLIANPGDDIEPSINKKSSFVVFSHRPPITNNGNLFQLYKKSLSIIQEPCIKAVN